MAYPVNAMVNAGWIEVSNNQGNKYCVIQMHPVDRRLYGRPTEISPKMINLPRHQQQPQQITLLTPTHAVVHHDAQVTVVGHQTYMQINDVVYWCWEKENHNGCDQSDH